jgi:hypothetical protein
MADKRKLPIDIQYKQLLGGCPPPLSMRTTCLTFSL